MSVLLILAASVVLLVLQTTLVESVSLAGVKPDLIFAAVYLTGFRLGASSGSIVGAVAGLLMDLLSAGPPGLNMATKAAVGFAAGLAGQAVLAGGVPRHVIALILFSVLQGGMTYGVIRLLGESPGWWSAAGYVILPQAVYDGVSGGLMVWLLSRWGWGMP